LGSPLNYGGGGGGGVYGTLESPQFDSGNGGIGGGGRGSRGAGTDKPEGVAGGVNTGGGGGGGGFPDSFGGAGGSGIVIVRYPSYLGTSPSGTGSVTTGTTGIWRFYRFTSSGSLRLPV
jgi:hypothetical protein